VWHRGLLHKLYLHGLDGQLLSWLQNYLSDRYQRVVIDGQQSEWGKVTAGVPQGSVIGPLLFLLFINDLTSCVQDVNIRLFADDTCVFIDVENREEAALAMNNDLARIECWASQWLVDFSVPKTKSLIISNKHDAHLNPPLRFKNENIKEVNSYNYLGLEINNDLRWGKHIQDIAIKARQKLNLMLPLKYKLDRCSLQTMYNSFVLSDGFYNGD
jgi:ribonuclease P/MRP protein subunit RPP40